VPPVRDGAGISVVRNTAKVILLAIVALLVMALPSRACLLAASETSTVLASLPEEAKSEPVVARVEIIELLDPKQFVDPDHWKYTSRVRVRVVEAIKGVQQDETFVVETRGTDCDDAFPRDEPKFETYRSHWRPYIAGQFYGTNMHGESETVFKGAWRGDLTTGKLIHVWP